jgi:hypothetical protein
MCPLIPSLPVKAGDFFVSRRAFGRGRCGSTYDKCRYKKTNAVAEHVPDG